LVEKLRKVSAGEPITADLWNALVAAVAPLAGLAVASPLELRSGANGVVISFARGWIEWYQLTENLEPGSHAKGKPLKYDQATAGGTYSLDSSADEEEIYDVFGTTTGNSGDRLPTFFNSRSGQRELLNIQCSV
jgi:hypothetical protein